MEYIRTKKGERYREMLWINGKSVKSPVFERKTDCKQWLIEQKSLRSRAQAYGESTKLYEKITVDEFSEKWLLSVKARDLAKTTQRNYESYFRVHIRPFFRGQQLKSVSKSDVENFQIHLSQNHNGKGTNMIMIVLRTFFRDAINDGYILKSPCEFIKMQSEINIHEAYWTDSEINQFLKANYKHPLHDLFLVALNTGMRKGELAALKWDRVDFSSNTITVTRTRDRHEIKERTKTNIRRVIPMNEIAKATLLSLFSSSQSEFVFLQNSEPIDVHHIYRVFEKAQLAAGIENKITFHQLRHTFASQFVMRGGSIYDLQKILGHTSITMTQRYAHLSLDHLHNAMRGFELGKESSQLGVNQILTMREKLIQKSV